jgi:heme-degrading monooxygenase HmoA
MTRGIRLWSQQPAFRSGTLLNSLGTPAKYVYLTRWDTREAFRSYARSEEFLAAQAADPTTGLSTPGRPAEAYESVLDVSSEGEAAYVTLIDWNIMPGTAADSEARRQEQYDLRKQHHGPGFVFSRLERFLGATTRYLTSIGYTTLAGLRATNAGPQLQAFVQAHPVNEHSSVPLVSEPYEVVVHAGR